MSLEIVFVMVGTTHSGNLGAAARAMKTMGFTRMRLVDTCEHLSPEALARSSGANDVLQEAQSFETLEQAIADCRVVVGTSARARQLAVPLLSCRQTCDEVGALSRTLPAGEKVAMIFGQER
jgi:tRNA (cytidine32/uridine32-2'-O)-methyltransferase